MVPSRRLGFDDVAIVAVDGSRVSGLPESAPGVLARSMHQRIDTLTIGTSGQGLYEFTRQARVFVASSGVGTGLLTAYVRHTSCSLLIQENADNDVKTDLGGFFRRLVPEGMDWLVHTTEGPDDMPAHIKSALTQTSIGIPVAEGRPVFGTWQGIYLSSTAAAHTGAKWCCT